MTDAGVQNLHERAAHKMQALMNSDPQLASLIPLHPVTQSICVPGQSLAEIMDRALEGYADRPAMGSRDYDVVEGADGRRKRTYKPAFETITYAELQSRIHAVANAWKNDPVHGVKPDEHVCIFGFTSKQLAILDFATAYAQAVTVPLQIGAANMDFEEILDSVRPVTVAVTVGDLVTVARYVVGKDYIRSLIVFDYDERVDDERERFDEAARLLREGASDIVPISLQQLEALGAVPAWRPLDAHEKGGARLASIVHSSGSTGTPKAAMIPETAIQFYWTSIAENAPPVISLCLAPFSHLLGKGTLVSALKQGGTAYFTLAPDLSTLFDDIRIARPTFLGVFPRIIELVYQHYQNGVGRELRSTGDSEEVVRERVKGRMAGGYLGDRLCFVLSGGSLVSPMVKGFFEDCFGIPLIDAYGNTEGGSVAINGFIQRPPVIDYKLRDVPDLGYFTSDKPYPRGEFCFKSVQSISGYLHAPDATKALFDEDGYICTGDIVEEYRPDHINIIDRRNDVLKLSQGEFVPIGALGAIFEGASDLISQIYIYGNSQRSYLLAVIVPNMTLAAAQIADENDEAALNTLIQEELHRIASKEGIRSFEVPKGFIIETEPFSDSNGLLSSLRKKIRPALARKYGDRLEALYENMERAKQEGRRRLAEPQSSMSVLEKLIRLLELDLNIKVVDGATSASFHELGGDSLGAVLLSLSIEEIFGVEIPADRILSPTGNPLHWAEMIEHALAGGDRRPTAARVHGKGATSISGSELDLAKFIDDETLGQAASLGEPVDEARTILLTGANGFLGRFVCLQWLERLAPLGGKLVCLVRAPDDLTARERLDNVFKGMDPELEARYDALARDHLDVLAGDVGEVQLGLNDDDYQRLIATVDRVVHVAALVNHRLSYANLFGANVVGTAEIIRFSMTKRKKVVDFVSTAAVYPLLETGGISAEDAPLLENINLSDAYAAGYGASKWAGEHLLRQAHEDYGLPVNVFRGDMMLPHQFYRGQVNTADMFARLLVSIIRTGLAPYSFYPLNADGSRMSAHYDGIPVDVVAASIAGANNVGIAYQTFNIENYHKDDGCSLDSFVDWIEESGYPVTRIKDYQAWFAALRNALRQLPENQQQYSAMEIMDAFAEPQPAGGGTVGCDRFKALVRGLEIGPDIPHLSRYYIQKCLRDLRSLGLIEAVEEDVEVEP